MAAFNIPVVIGVNEEEIARQIEKEVKDRVIANISEEVKKIIYKEETSGYYYGNRSVTYSDEPLRSMIVKEVEKSIDEHKDLIIELAAEKLADKLSRSKVVKERAAAVVKEVFKEK